MRYELNHGRIQTWALEAHVVDHCNLRCRGCCSLSPELPERFTPLAELERDVTRAAAVLQPMWFKLTGGEPLLHPELPALLAIARRSGIARHYSLTTNGLLAAKAPDALFEQLDRLTLSAYSSAPLPAATVERLEARCAEHRVHLNLKAVERFQQLDAPVPNDAASARLVYQGCWMKDRCHLLYQGHFFTCTRPPHFAALRPALDGFADGVPLGSPALLADVLAYLEREEPLAACTSCLGRSGGWFPHQQLSRPRRPRSERAAASATRPR